MTDVRISLRDEGALRALVTVIIDDCFIVRGLKIMEARGTLFVAMPSRRRPDGSYEVVPRPVPIEARATLEEAVFAKYHEARKRGDDGCESAGVRAPLLPTLGPLIAAMRKAIPRDADIPRAAG